MHYNLQIIQIKCDDDLFSIIFIKQTCVFNNKNIKKNYSDNTIKNSNINEKKNVIYLKLKSKSVLYLII